MGHTHPPFISKAAPPSNYERALPIPRPEVDQHTQARKDEGLTVVVNLLLLDNGSQIGYKSVKYYPIREVL
jgi:hypothetical protein